MCIVVLKLNQLFAHIGVRTERGPKCYLFISHPCHFKKKISFLSFIMFISLKLEQMKDFVLSVRLKRRAQKERHNGEREREAISEESTERKTQERGREGR